MWSWIVLAGWRTRLAVRTALCVAALAGAAPAFAQNVPGTAYFGGSPSNIVVSVPVIATVGGQCGFASGAAPSGSYNAGAIDTTAWSNDFTFTLQCTGPSRIAILSTNGGLKRSPTAALASGYTDLAPYDVAVHVVRSGGTTDGTCPAASLLSTSIATCALRGTASTTVGMQVATSSTGLSGSYVRVSAPAFSGSNILINGTYTDTLVVTVSPSV